MQIRMKCIQLKESVAGFKADFVLDQDNTPDGYTTPFPTALVSMECSDLAQKPVLFDYYYVNITAVSAP